MYGWLTAENSRETAQKLVDNTEDEIDDLTDEIKAQNTKIAEYEIALESAKKAYELGVIEEGPDALAGGADAEVGREDGGRPESVIAEALGDDAF